MNKSGRLVNLLCPIVAGASRQERYFEKEKHQNHPTVLSVKCGFHANIVTNQNKSSRTNAPYMNPKPGASARVFICVQTNT